MRRDKEGEFNKAQPPCGGGNTALEWLQALVCSVVLVALCFTFGVRIVGVEGVSMEPTLQPNDKLLVVSALWTEPQNGDIVVLRKDSWI